MTDKLKRGDKITPENVHLLVHGNLLIVDDGALGPQPFRESGSWEGMVNMGYAGNGFAVPIERLIFHAEGPEESACVTDLEQLTAVVRLHVPIADEDASELTLAILNKIIEITPSPRTVDELVRIRDGG